MAIPLPYVRTWTMQPPRPMPSKNWWKLRAPTRGLIVDGLSDAPRDTPMITECTRIPSSRTCTATDLTDGYLLIPSWSKNLQRGARLCGWLAKKERIDLFLLPAAVCSAFSRNRRGNVPCLGWRQQRSLTVPWELCPKLSLSGVLIWFAIK